MSILADFVLNESEHPENAASNALLLVLRRSPGARDGLAAFLERLGIGALGSVWIEREATGENGERPDFSVRDQAGVENAASSSRSSGPASLTTSRWVTSRDWDLRETPVSSSSALARAPSRSGVNCCSDAVPPVST